ncbi:Shr3 amino acid permease chaperone [Amylocystis lapponica]|nr:Shr3 amino acid permease chaperone [Amylocystis lapponica]KAH9948157.1 Shr3 amino acid permease chaperone [Amylocystis lapponica]
MAGLRMSIVVSATSFLLGLLFTHWIADSLTLWKTPQTQTDLRLWTAATYYSILTRMPVTLACVYPAVMVLGGATILWSLRDGRAGNLMFDGGSIFLYGAAVAVYIYSVLPNISENFTSLPLPFPSQTTPSSSSTPPLLPPFPASLRTPTLELASSNLVCSVMLTGVLTLQAGRWWAEQTDAEDDEAEMTGDGDEDNAEKEKEKSRGRRREKAPLAGPTKS